MGSALRVLFTWERGGETPGKPQCLKRTGKKKHRPAVQAKRPSLKNQVELVLWAKRKEKNKNWPNRLNMESDK